MIDYPFQQVFGSAWDTLPPVFKKRYSNRSFSNDVSTVQGRMDIGYSKLMACFIPLFRLFRILVPYSVTNIPVTVDFVSHPDSALISMNRQFFIPDRKPYPFNSTVEVIKNNDVLEHMAYGLSWQIHYFYETNKVVMQHHRYIFRFFKWRVPLPLELFLGKCHCEERVIDDNSYRVTMNITHPWFGLMYHYAGDFTFTRLPT